MADSKEIDVEVLEDAKLKITTDTIDHSVHKTADEMMKWIALMTGSQPQVVKRTKKSSTSKHTHHHEH